MNISSIGVKYGGSYNSMDYTFSKSALESITTSLAKQYTSDNIFIATVLATVVASYTVEGFGVEALLKLDIDNIYERYEKYLKLIGQKTYISLDNLKGKLDI